MIENRFLYDQLLPREKQPKCKYLKNDVSDISYPIFLLDVMVEIFQNAIKDKNEIVKILKKRKYELHKNKNISGELGSIDLINFFNSIMIDQKKAEEWEICDDREQPY